MQQLTLTEFNQQLGSEWLRAEVWIQFSRLNLKLTAGGKEYLELEIRDAAGRQKFNYWGNLEYFELLKSLVGKSDLFYSIAGEWKRGDFGLESRDLRFNKLDDSQIEQLLSGDSELQQQREQRLLELFEQIVDPRLRLLVETIYKQHRQAFLRCAAARSIHHARRGGLIEHTLGLMESALVLGRLYNLNVSLLLSGAFLHDIGKLWETCPPQQGFDMPFDKMGELLGHITIGMLMINQYWRSLESRFAEYRDKHSSNEDLRLHLLHLIASHHGELQFGSPVTPKTPEALLLNFVDNLDAKMEIYRQAYRSNEQIGDGMYAKSFPLSSNLVESLPDWPAASPNTPGSAAASSVAAALAAGGFAEYPANSIATRSLAEPQGLLQASAAASTDFASAGVSSAAGASFVSVETAAHDSAEAVAQSPVKAGETPGKTAAARPATPEDTAKASKNAQPPQTPPQQPSLFDF